MTTALDINLLAPVVSVAQAGSRAAQAEELGFGRIWFTQGQSVDAIAVAQAVGSRCRTLRSGPAVVPIQGRHPAVLAQQALTTYEALDGRFDLGVGVSHEPTVRGIWGLEHRHPVAQMINCLDIVQPLLRGEEVHVEGPWWCHRGALSVPPGPRPKVFLSALGPRMLALAAERADGVITWLVGPRTLQSMTVPALRSRAEEVGRSAPPLVVGVPVCCTEDPVDARARMVAQFGGQAALAAYRSTLAREGADSIADLAVCGGPAEVEDRLRALVSLGADAVMADVFGDDAERDATMQLLAELHGPVIDLTAPAEVFSPRAIRRP